MKIVIELVFLELQKAIQLLTYFSVKCKLYWRALH